MTDGPQAPTGWYADPQNPGQLRYWTGTAWTPGPPPPYAPYPLKRAGIDPARFTVEMTESMVADDRDTVREVLTQLRRLGVRTAIDDFGTGYSSLSYLKHLPLDTLKIDQTFIEGLGSDPRDAAIVASTIAVSQALGLFTVAEGVESQVQLGALRALGCD